ncbi:pentatricopeptide repeat-containing protein At5g56310 [Lactuca sativa]|uniref:pentatricopeptide repeat-containing protein At5g56310 n=1 Tax=Lactuca sativa TaxID=4236 RepID=UPI000CBA9EAD|nr:pentatricopeptide repeat-containing protein At5g56310 [Lactuca sativa]
MPYKDTATWSFMIMGLATNGRNESAITLFEEMTHKGPVPNDITFVAVLVACNHKSLVTKAWCLIGKMFKVFGIQPGIEHYGCMVDVLARSGQLKRAEILIDLMPMKPDEAIWGSFLHGCLRHSEICLGERVVKRLIALDPNQSGRYVGLANMYADIGRWENVIRLRNMMVERKVDNTPSWSFIKVDGVVHKFFCS